MASEVGVASLVLTVDEVDLLLLLLLLLLLPLVLVVPLLDLVVTVTGERVVCPVFPKTAPPMGARKTISEKGIPRARSASPNN